MKYIATTILFCALLICSHAATPSADSVCTLTGHIRGLGDRRIIFSYFPDTNTYIADTIRASHGRFTFTTHLTEPRLYNITTLRNNTKKRKKRTGYSVAIIGKTGRRYGSYRDALLENRAITWDTKMSNFSRSPFKNAPLNDTLLYIENIPLSVYRTDKALLEWRKQNPGYKSPTFPVMKAMQRDSLMNAMRKRQGDSIAAFIIAHPSSYASASNLWRIMYSDHAVKVAAYNALDTSLRRNVNVVSYKRRLDNYISQVHKGDLAPEITLADTSGRQVSLSSVRGKVTLIDFWASWCGPCRRENPNVVRAYHKYEKKGLRIYAVSLDMDKQNWVKAIEKDQLPWTHVSDLKGWDAQYARVYGVTGVPNNLLLDANGKVIATDLRGNDLSRYLHDILR